MRAAIWFRKLRFALPATTNNTLAEMLRDVDRTVVMSIWRSLVVLVVGAGLLLAAVRLMLPGIDQYRPQVAAWVSELLGRPVRIEGLSAGWQGWAPELHVRGIELLPENGSSTAPVARFARASIVLDPLASLRAGEPRARRVSISGASFAVARGPNGAFDVAGLAERVADAGAGAALAGWLLHEGSLEFDSTRVVWLDAAAHRGPIAFEGVRVSLANEGNRHRLHAVLPLRSGSGSITVTADVTGDLRTPAWSGRVFVAGEGVALDALARADARLAAYPVHGRGTFRVWSKWRFGRLRTASGDFHLDALKVPAAWSAVGLRRASGRIELARSHDEWTLALHDLELWTALGRAPTTRVTMTVSTAPGHGAPRVRLEADRMRAADLVPLLRPSLSTALGASPELALTGLEGDIVDPQLAFSATDHGPAALELRARVSGLGLPAAGRRPRLSGLDGTLEATATRGAIRLASGRIDGLMPDRYTKPPSVRVDDSLLAWSRSSAGLAVDMPLAHLRSGGVTATLAGRLWWAGHGVAPEVRLAGELGPGDLAALRPLIPDRVLPRLSKWLDHAIVAGRYTGGRVVVRTSDDPSAHDRWQATAALRVAGGTMRYATGWPEITGVEGELRVTGHHLDASLDGASVSGARVLGATVHIEDVAVPTPLVEIRGRAVGTSQDGLRFLGASPLRGEFQELLDNVSAQGDAALDLALDVRVHHRKPARVDGRLKLAANSVEMTGFETGLSNVNGEIRFGGDGLRARDVSAMYLGKPIRVDAAPATSADAATRITISGQATPAYLLRHLLNRGLLRPHAKGPPPWLAHFSGSTPWTATVNIPHALRSGQSLRLRVESSLKGIAVALPAPFGKPANVSREVVVDSLLGGKAAARLDMRYGDVASAVFELTDRPGRGRITRGAIGVGRATPRLPDTPGIVVEGRVADLSVGDWVDLVRQQVRAGNGADASGAVVSDVRALSLEAHHANVWGHRIDDTRLDAMREPDGGWRLRLTGTDVAGEVRVPASGKAVIATFDRLALHTGAPQRANPPIDPASLPPIDFSCRHLEYGDHEVGVIKVTTRPVPDGLHVDSLYVLSPAYEAHANGAWKNVAGGGTASSFDIQVHSDALGSLLAQFGYEGRHVTGAVADVLLEAKWPGPPAAFDLGKVKGVLHFRTGAGRLLDVKRGATGRAFGLFVLGSLPRRLRLDFSDLFDRGLAFDRLEGSFALDGGEAYTNNLMLDSETARIDVAGRTGLVTHDYDQVVTVTPKLSASLPLVPIWLAEKVLRKQLLDQAFAYRYTVTGSWDNPVVKPIKVRAIPAQRD